MIEDITIKLLNESGEKMVDRGFQAATPLAGSQRFHESLDYVKELTTDAENIHHLSNYQILIEVRQT